MVATDADDDDLEYRVTISSTFGSVVVNSDGSFTYSPTVDFNGLDTFSFVASDGKLDSNEAVVNLTVNNVPDITSASVTTSDAASVFGILEATDEDGADILFELIEPPQKGQLIDFMPTGEFTYVPNAEADGLDEFVIVASDAFSSSPSTPQSIEIFAHPTVIRFGTPGNDQISTEGMFYDAAGNLVIAGVSAESLTGDSASGSSHKFVRKYDRRGSPIWTISVGDPAFGSFRRLLPIPGSDDFLVLISSSGFAQVLRFQSDGTEVWSSTVDYGTDSVLIAGEWADVLPNGDLILASTRSDSSTFSSSRWPVVSRISSADGTNVWQVEFAPDDNFPDLPLLENLNRIRPKGIAIDTSGNILLLSDRNDPFESLFPFLLTLSENGTVINAELLNLDPSACGSSVQITLGSIGSDGSLYVRGFVFGANPAATVLLARLSADGQQRFFQKCSAYEGLQGSPLSNPLVFDDGSVLDVTAISEETQDETGTYSFAEVGLTKYSINGDLLWQQLPESGPGPNGSPGGSLTPGSIIEDDQGLLYLGGGVFGELEGTMGPLFGNDVFLLRMDEHGVRR